MPHFAFCFQPAVLMRKVLASRMMGSGKARSAGKALHGFEDAASDDVSLDLAEPYLHLVEPGRIGRGEVETHLGMSLRKVLYGLGFVRREVVEHERGCRNSTYRTSKGCGIWLHVRPSNVLPAFFLFTPPHCLKKNCTPALRH